uniref:Putative secreted protein n=1 Tax=Desmodus rotundus TaxID=9430 RepID=K9IYM9_DESRO
MSVEWPLLCPAAWMALASLRTVLFSFLGGLRPFSPSSPHPGQPFLLPSPPLVQVGCRPPSASQPGDRRHLDVYQFRVFCTDPVPLCQSAGLFVQNHTCRWYGFARHVCCETGASPGLLRCIQPQCAGFPGTAGPGSLAPCHMDRLRRPLSSGSDGGFPCVPLVKMWLASGVGLAAGLLCFTEAPCPQG